MYNIYQIYYDQNSYQYLDKDFIPYNNSSPIKEKEFEYGVMRNLYLNNQLFKDNSKYASVFSWKFKHKTMLDGKDFIDWVNKNKGYDVYFINPFPELANMYFSVWWQGEYWHPGIISLVEELLLNTNIQLNIKDIRNTIKTCCYCNYWIANKKFWDLFMSISEEMYKSVYESDDITKELLFNVKADGHINAAMFPFIFERIFSTVLTLGDFKVLNYPNLEKNKNSNFLLKHVLETTSKKIKDIDSNKDYSKEDIEFINSIGAMYHDKLFNRLKPYEEYECNSILRI